MPRLVKKFGGTSLAGLDGIRNAAMRVKAARDKGFDVVVVVSAMAGTTNELITYCREASPMHDAREFDAVVASGEQITAGLFAIILQAMGIPARSWLGWQLPVRTNGMHGSAEIIEVDTAIIESRLDQHEVAVVCGFQGLAPDNRITTLGRGGSDLSAVALAAALGAKRCDIYTDVAGIFTADPRIVPNARKLDRVSYEEMLEMASDGATVLQARSVLAAMRHKVPVQVLSTFEYRDGTHVVDEADMIEQRVVSGVVCSRDEAGVTLSGLPNTPGVVARVFEPLASKGIMVDMIVQGAADRDGKAALTFTVPREDVEIASEALEAARAMIGFATLTTQTRLVKISIIGQGMAREPGIARRMFEALAEAGINIEAISTSEIKISVLIPEDYAELAIRTLHAAYDLEQTE